MTFFSYIYESLGPRPRFLPYIFTRPNSERAEKKKRTREKRAKETNTHTHCIASLQSTAVHKAGRGETLLRPRAARRKTHSNVAEVFQFCSNSYFPIFKFCSHLDAIIFPLNFSICYYFPPLIYQVLLRFYLLNQIIRSFKCPLALQFYSHAVPNQNPHHLTSMQKSAPILTLFW